MARPKKTTKFEDIISKLSLEDKKILLNEVNYSIKEEERKESGEAKMAEAIKKRDALKIGATASYMLKGEKISGEVIQIGMDKVKLDIDGNKKSVSILKLV